jgi:hypothetical protein
VFTPGTQIVSNSLAGEQTTRTLRIFLSHTVCNQVWQTGGKPEDSTVNFETGEGIPTWSLKIEGRLLEVCLPDTLIAFTA